MAKIESFYTWKMGGQFFSTSMVADYSFYVKSIATYAPTFFRYNNSLLAIVHKIKMPRRFFSFFVFFFFNLGYVEFDMSHYNHVTLSVVLTNWAVHIWDHFDLRTLTSGLTSTTSGCTVTACIWLLLLLIYNEFIGCFHQFVSRIFSNNCSQFEQLKKKTNFLLVQNGSFSQFASWKPVRDIKKRNHEFTNSRI